MNTRQLFSRVLKLENLAYPQSNPRFTLEDVCRSLWRMDKKAFREISKDSIEQLFITRFEREDAEALPEPPTARERR